MKALISILTTETQLLKEDFLTRTAQYSKAEFKRISLLTEEDFKNNSGVSFYSIVKEKTVNDHSKASYAAWSKTENAVRNGLEVYLAKAEKAAIAHYHNSIQKLALRIVAKGLNLDNLEVKTYHIGVNIETTLTDGEKTVRAFTIIAGGPVQKPHYRYLIK